MKGRVGSGTDRPLPTLSDHPTWRSGGVGVSFRASITRGDRKWQVKVTCVDEDQERAFVTIESVNGRSVGTQTCWVSIDELQEL